MILASLEESARIGDYYSVCSRKIGGVVIELRRTHECLINNCAIVNIHGRNFSEITIAFVAPRTIIICFNTPARGAKGDKRETERTNKYIIIL